MKILSIDEVEDILEIQTKLHIKNRNNLDTTFKVWETEYDDYGRGQYVYSGIFTKRELLSRCN